MTARWLSALLCTGLTVSAAHAQYFAQAQYTSSYPAPGACSPGYFCPAPWGCQSGQSYCVRPPFPPVSGVAPPPFGPGGYGGGYGGCGSGCIPPIAAFPTHPYARGPRDYFMWTEAQQELITRERRPPYVP